MQGFWNGEPATFRGVTYELVEAPQPLWWQNCHVGQRRQGLEMTQGSETWIIDNEYGDGYYKVTIGMGSPRCGHKSVHNPINVEPIPDTDIRTVYDAEGLAIEATEHDDWMREKNPEEFERMQRLKAGLKAHQEKYKL